MNDTPRTDEVYYQFNPAPQGAMVNAMHDIARVLERENNELRETIKNTEQLLREAIADAAKFATDNQMFRDQAHDAQKRSNEAFVELRALRAKLTRAESFDGVLDLLRSRYPSDVFDGSSGDAGAMVAVLTQKLADAEREINALTEWGKSVDEKTSKLFLSMSEQLDTTIVRAEAAEKERDTLLAKEIPAETTPSGLLYRYRNDRVFHELVDQLALSKFLPQRDEINNERDTALAEVARLRGVVEDMERKL